MPNSMPETPSFGSEFSYAEMAKKRIEQGSHAAKVAAAAAEARRETQRPGQRILEVKPKETPTEHLKTKDIESSQRALNQNILEVEADIKAAEAELSLLAEADKLKAEGKIALLRKELFGYKRELKDIEATSIGFEEAEEFGRKLEEQARPAQVVEEPEIITNVTDRGVPQATAFPTRERMEEETAPVMPKKSWFPASIRKWGIRALVGLGLIAAAKPAAEEMERLGQAASQTYADYEKGVQSFAEGTPMVQEARMRESVAALEKQKAERLVAGQPVEVGGKTVQIQETGSTRTHADQERFLREELPRMVEQAKKTLGIESGLPVGYNETSFLNDEQFLHHFFRTGATENITMPKAGEAMGRMIRFNRERARAVLAKETRDQFVAKETVDKIFGEFRG